MSLLTAKFQIPEFQQILANTKKEYLLEFDRGAKRNKPKWSGLVEENVLYGDNVMGQYLMRVRDLCYE